MGFPSSSLGLALLIFLSASPAHSESHGNYSHAVDGFYESRFDEVGTLSGSGCTNPGPGRLFRSGEPDFSNPNTGRTLADNHIGFIVDLRAETSDLQDRERRYALSNGLGYVHFPLRGSEADPEQVTVTIYHPPTRRGGRHRVQRITVPTGEGAASVVEFIKRRLAASTNVLIHCAAGADRTGAMVGLYRGCDAWRAEFDAYGGHLYTPLERLMENARTPDALRHYGEITDRMGALSGPRRSCPH